jgi:MEMO1 family protein
MSYIQSSFGSKGWYPATEQELNAFMAQYMQPHLNAQQGAISALICPHAGYTYSGRVLGQTMQYTCNQAYERIIVVSPSHYVSLGNQCVVPGIHHMRTEFGESSLDIDCVNALKQEDYGLEGDDIVEKEHGIWMMMPFLQKLHPNTPVCPIVIGDLTRETLFGLADTLRSFTSNTLIVISSDFTHYGNMFNYVPFTQNISQQIQDIDFKAKDFIANNDFDGFWDWFNKTPTTICGRFGIATLLYMLQKRDTKVMHTCYEQSGALTNDWDHSVSYLGMAIGVS